MRDPILGQIGLFILILALGLYVIFVDNNDNDKGGGFA